MIEAALALGVLNFLALTALLFRLWPAWRESQLERLADQGIALAEQMAKHHSGASELTSHDKMREAVEWTRSAAKRRRMSAPDAHIRKLLELRLRQGGGG